MNLTIFLLILFTFIISTLTYRIVQKKRKNKWLSLLCSFLMNSLILGSGALLLYLMDVQAYHKGTEGMFDSLGIFVFVLFIPIISLVNVYAYELSRK